MIRALKPINAATYERAQVRTVYVNCFKPHYLQTAIGELNLAFPQVCVCSAPFRTSLLESGSRTDRYLEADIAGMYRNRPLFLSITYIFSLFTC